MMIDRLTYEDLPEFATFYEQCFDYVSDLDTLQKGFEELVDHPDYYLLTAKDNGRIVGYTMAVVIRDFVGDGTPMMTLWSVCTHPGERRKGIGRALILQAEDVAKRRNCEFITFITGTQRSEAHSFYKSLGYDLKRDKAGIKYL